MRARTLSTLSLKSTEIAPRRGAEAPLFHGVIRAQVIAAHGRAGFRSRLRRLACAQVTSERSGECGERTAELDDVLGRLFRKAFQRARPDQHRQCPQHGGEVGLPDRSHRQAGDDSLWSWTEFSTRRGRTIAPLRLMRGRDGRSGCTSGRFPSDIRPCCGHVNRGLAILGDKVFMGTLDAHVIALDAKTGNVVWDVVAADYRTGHSFTVAPLAVKDLDRDRRFRRRIRGARVSSMLTMPTPAQRNGASTRCRDRASRDTTPGKAIRGKSAARQRGIRERTIRRRIKFSGRREILRRRIAAKAAPATISTAIPCWRSNADYGQTELVFPVHQARRARLGRDADSGDGGCGRKASDRAGQPQRIFLRASIARTAN